MTAPLYRSVDAHTGEKAAAELDRLRDENAELWVRVQELTALAAAQADEIRSLQLAGKRVMRQRGGW